MNFKNYKMSLQWEINEKLYILYLFWLLFNEKPISCSTPKNSGPHEAFKNLEISLKFRKIKISLCGKFFVWPQIQKFFQIYINFHEKYRFLVKNFPK